MPMKTYTLEEALLEAHDTSTKFFLSRVGSQLVVISNHISVWMEIEGGYELRHRIFYDYTYQDDMRYRRGDEKINLPIYPQSELEEVICERLSKITYTKTYDVDMPENIIKFDKEFTRLIEQFDYLDVLVKDFSCDEFDYKRDEYCFMLFNCEFTMEDLKKFARKIRRTYIREVKRHNDLPEENHCHGLN